MSDKVKFFTRFNPPPSPSIVFHEASLTRQEFVQESDINNIMKRYASGMPLPSGNRVPMYGDYSDVPDYARAFDIVTHAQDCFSSLPSEVRRRFDNDPAKLLAFLSDPANKEEGIELGLFKAPGKAPESVSVPDEKSGEGE